MSNYYDIYNTHQHFEVLQVFICKNYFYKSFIPYQNLYSRHFDQNHKDIIITYSIIRNFLWIHQHDFKLRKYKYLLLISNQEIKIMISTTLFNIIIHRHVQCLRTSSITIVTYVEIINMFSTLRHTHPVISSTRKTWSILQIDPISIWQYISSNMKFHMYFNHKVWLPIVVSFIKRKSLSSLDN